MNNHYKRISKHAKCINFCVGIFRFILKTKNSNAGNGANFFLVFE